MREVGGNGNLGDHFVEKEPTDGDGQAIKAGLVATRKRIFGGEFLEHDQAGAHLCTKTVDEGLMNFFSGALEGFVQNLNRLVETAGHHGAMLENMTAIGTAGWQQFLTRAHFNQGIDDGRAFDQMFAIVQHENGYLGDRVKRLDGFDVFGGRQAFMLVGDTEGLQNDADAANKG